MMISWIAQLVLALFAAVGMWFVLRQLSFYFFFRQERTATDMKILLKVEKHDIKLEYILRSLLKSLEGIYTLRGQPDIYIIEEGLQKEERTIAALFEQQHANVHLCREQTVRQLMEEL